jgi:hypothetical protein
MWIYGEGDGMPLAELAPHVEFLGLSLSQTDYTDNAHGTTPGAAAVAVKYSSDLKTTGTLRTTARQNGMVAQTAMDLVAP